MHQDSPPRYIHQVWGWILLAVPGHYYSTITSTLIPYTLNQASLAYTTILTSTNEKVCGAVYCSRLYGYLYWQVAAIDTMDCGARDLDTIRHCGET